MEPSGRPIGGLTPSSLVTPLTGILEGHWLSISFGRLKELPSYASYASRRRLSLLPIPQGLELVVLPGELFLYHLCQMPLARTTALT